LALTYIKNHVMGEGQAPAPLPPPQAVQPLPPAPRALTLSDLPSVTDLLEMGNARPPAPQPSPSPLADTDDDDSLIIEPPMLPEPPTTVKTPAPAPERAEPVPILAPVAPLPAPPALPPPPAVASPKPPRPATPSPARPKADPLAALAALKADVQRPAAPKAKPLDHKDAINSLLGELTMVGRSGAPSVLRLDLPAELDAQDIEVVVQLRAGGQVVSEGQLRRPVPSKGATAKLSLEIKRG